MFPLPRPNPPHDHPPLVGPPPGIEAAYEKTRHRIGTLCRIALGLFIYISGVFFYYYCPINPLIFLFFSFLLVGALWNWLGEMVPLWMVPGSHPPGHLPLPIFGSLLTINSREPQRTLLEMAAKYGSVFSIHIPEHVVVFTGFNELQTVARMSKASARPTSYIWTIFMKGYENGLGVILSSGGTWTKARDFINKFLRASGVNSTDIERQIEDRMMETVKYIEGSVDEGKKNNQASIDIEPQLTYVVSSIIIEIVLGQNYQYKDERILLLKTMLDDILKGVQSVSMLLINRHNWLKRFLSADRKYRLHGGKLTNFFEGLRVLSKEAYEAIGEMIPRLSVYTYHLKYPEILKNGDDDVSIVVGDLWTGGMETTLTAIRWGIIYLMQHPEVQERLHAEVIHRYERRSVGTYDYEGREQLPFLCGCTDEILRLANVLPWNIPHRATDDFTINGYTIKAGTQLMLSYSSLHHDEQHFPDPYRFNPDRFLQRDGTYRASPFLHPFGMGKRNCPGETLARKELFVFLIALSQRFRFIIDPSCPPDTTRPRGMTSVPPHYKCIIQKREDWYGPPEKKINNRLRFLLLLLLVLIYGLVLAFFIYVPSMY